MTGNSSSLAVKIIAIILIAGLILAVIASTGVFYVPVVSETLGTTTPKDLGINYDPAKFYDLLDRENVTLSGPASDYPLTASIRYGPSAPMDATVTSEELTAMMQETNNANGPLKNMQVRLGNNNQMEISANADLAQIGYPFKGPVYLKGTLEKADSGSVKITLTEGTLGLVPIPEFGLQQGEAGLAKAINHQLASMPGMQINTLSINNGQLHYTGEFPQTATA
ncbi:MAG: hypothetical protein LUQ54_00570 [Methanoregula sp.]|nr:hypothetical protein [Methanoregula sp.]